MAAVPSTVGVIGGGRMGAGIAQVFAAAGAHVVIVEPDPGAATLRRVAAGLSRAAERGTLTGEPGPVELAAAVPPDAGLVVEAVPENAELKASVLAGAERAAPKAILATNTSSLSIGGLAKALARPGQLIGLHFFNPVPASELVEIVTGPDTAGPVLAAARDWVDALGKTAIVVRDSPGFATSRLGVLLGLEAIRMLAEGVADAESIDRAMELGYRHPTGPLRSTDLVGLDVRLAIAEHLHATLGDRFAPPQLLRDKVALGELGRKSGRGFYDWEVTR
jgi:3-hydroxybutyryl-CoA dehydrogenase